MKESNRVCGFQVYLRTATVCVDEALQFARDGGEMLFGIADVFSWHDEGDGSVFGPENFRSE